VVRTTELIAIESYAAIRLNSKFTLAARNTQHTASEFWNNETEVAKQSNLNNAQAVEKKKLSSLNNDSGNLLTVRPRG